MEYRVFGKYHAVNILTAPKDSIKQLAADPTTFNRCSDKIVATLKLPEIRRSEIVTFDCQMNSPNSSEDMVIVGVGDNREGRRIRFRPRLAWTASIEPPGFKVLNPKSVVCEAKSAAGTFKPQ
jgi:hypothetical protein